MLLNILALLGLILAFAGFATILIPDIPYLRFRVMPEDEIDELQTAQQTLFANQEITDDPNFTALYDLLEPNLKVSVAPHKILIGDDRNRENTVVQVRHTDPDADHTYATEFIGHPTQISVLVDEHIRQLRQNVRHRYLTIGVALLAAGFALRITVRAWQIWRAL